MFMACERESDLKAIISKMKLLKITEGAKKPDRLVHRKEGN